MYISAFLRDITTQFTDNMIQRRRKHLLLFQCREYIDLSFDVSVLCLASLWHDLKY